MKVSHKRKKDKAGDEVEGDKEEPTRSQKKTSGKNKETIAIPKINLRLLIWNRQPRKFFLFPSSIL